MKIETKKVVKEWKKGDVIVNEDGNYIALIVGDNHNKYCAMDINPDEDPSKAYTTDPDEIYIANNQTYFDSIEEMQDAFTIKGWHKVNAVLKIDADVLVGYLKC